MKTLYIVRHAKSSWESAAMTDFERPLNDRGLKSAPHMAKLLKEKKVHPDLIIASPARRALETAEIFSETLGYPEEKILTQIEIYHGGINNMQKIVHAIPESCEVAMIVGHNPTLTDFTNFLTGEGNHIDGFVTCGVARIDLDLDSWKKVKGGSGRLAFYEFPKKHQ
jgi:phosphohistidine phosphatase